MDIKIDYKPIHTDGLDQLLRDELGENYTGMSLNKDIEEFILHFTEEPTPRELAHALGLIQDHDAEASKKVFEAPKPPAEAAPQTEIDLLKAEIEALKARLDDWDDR